MKHNEDHFEVLRKIKKNSDRSQRELANELGFSLVIELLLESFTKKAL